MMYHNIAIEFVKNGKGGYGAVVAIGCQRFVTDDMMFLGQALSEYFVNPSYADTVMAKYGEDGPLVATISTPYPEYGRLNKVSISSDIAGASEDKQAHIPRRNRPGPGAGSGGTC